MGILGPDGEEASPDVPGRVAAIGAGGVAQHAVRYRVLVVGGPDERQEAADHEGDLKVSRITAIRDIGRRRFAGGGFFIFYFLGVGGG